MKSSKTSGFRSWSTRDLLITVVIGLAFGVLLIPVTYAYAALLPLGILARSLMGGVYYLPAAFSSYVMRRPGAIMLVSLVSALVAMPFTPYGLIVLLIGVLTGVLGELVTWFVTRYRNFDTKRMVVAGSVAGLLEFILILGSLRTTNFDYGILTAALLVSAFMFGFCGALGKWLADSVAKTGVLSNTPLGKSVIDEI